MKHLKKLIAVLMVVSLAAGMSITAEAEDMYKLEQIRQICTEVGEEYGICPEILYALIERESGFREDITSADGTCIGLCQLSEKYFGGPGIDLTDPRTNITLAAEYMIKLRGDYGDMAAVLMAYHGEKNVRSKAESGQISSYAKWILKRAAELEEE